MKPRLKYIVAFVCTRTQEPKRRRANNQNLIQCDLGQSLMSVRIYSFNMAIKKVSKPATCTALDLSSQLNKQMRSVKTS